MAIGERSSGGVYLDNAACRIRWARVARPKEGQQIAHLAVTSHFSATLFLCSLARVAGAGSGCPKTRLESVSQLPLFHHGAPTYRSARNVHLAACSAGFVLSVRALLRCFWFWRELNHKAAGAVATEAKAFTVLLAMIAGSRTQTRDQRGASVVQMPGRPRGGTFRPGTSIFGCVRRIAAQSGRFDASIMTTENSGPLFSCSRTYNPRILKAMSRPFWRALQFAVLRLSICSRRSLPLPTGSVKNLVSSAFMSGSKCLSMSESSSNAWRASNSGAVLRMDSRA